MAADGLLFKSDHPAVNQVEPEPFEVDPEVGVPTEANFENNVNGSQDTIMGECLQEDLPLALWSTQGGGAGPSVPLE
jgi:hypothetical protein